MNVCGVGLGCLMLMTGALLAYLGMDALMDMTGTYFTVPDVHLAKIRYNDV